MSEDLRRINFGIMKRKPPCGGCTDRHFMCHGSCEKYIEWTQENGELRAVVLASANEQRAVRQVEIERMERARRCIQAKSKERGRNASWVTPEMNFREKD